MSSIAFSLLSLSILYVIQTVDYIVLELTGALLLKPLVSGIATTGFGGLSALCGKAYYKVTSPFMPLFFSLLVNNFIKQNRRFW